MIRSVYLATQFGPPNRVTNFTSSSSHMFKLSFGQEKVQQE